MADGPGAHIFLGPLERAKIRFKHRRVIGSDTYELRVEFDEIVGSNLWSPIPPMDDLLGSDEADETTP